VLAKRKEGSHSRGGHTFVGLGKEGPQRASAKVLVSNSYYTPSGCRGATCVKAADVGGHWTTSALHSAFNSSAAARVDTSK